MLYSVVLLPCSSCHIASAGDTNKRHCTCKTCTCISKTTKFDKVNVKTNQNTSLRLCNTGNCFDGIIYYCTSIIITCYLVFNIISMGINCTIGVSTDMRTSELCQLITFESKRPKLVSWCTIACMRLL